jgi:hypothetical protein
MKDDGFKSKDWLRLIATVAWLVVFVMWPRLTAGITLLIAGGAMMAFNAMIFFETVVRKRQASSVAPIFGGILAAAGIALLPIDGVWKWAWIPLLLDWGGLPVLVTVWRASRNQN